MKKLARNIGFWKLAAGFSVLAVIGGLTYFWIAVRPWLVGAPESEELTAERWDRVKEWAKPLHGAGRSEELWSLLRAYRESGVESPELGAPEDAFIYLPLAEQPAELRTAIDGLLEWREARGAAYPTRPVEPENRFPTLAALRFGRHALYAASARQPEIAAAVQDLANGLLHAGTLLEALVGSILAKLVGRWQFDRSVARLPLQIPIFEESSMYRIAAREAVFYDRLIGQTAELEPRRPRDGPPFARVFLAREQALHRWHSGKVAQTLFDHREDLPRGFDQLEQDAQVEPPRSLVLNNNDLVQNKFRELHRNLRAAQRYVESAGRTE